MFFLIDDHSRNYYYYLFQNFSFPFLLFFAFLFLFPLCMNIIYQTFCKCKAQEIMVCIPVVLTLEIQQLEKNYIIQRLPTWASMIWILTYSLRSKIKVKKLVSENFVAITVLFKKTIFCCCLCLICKQQFMQ